MKSPDMIRSFPSAARRWCAALLAGVAAVSFVMPTISAQQPASTAPPAPVLIPGFRQANQVGVVTIEGEVDSVTLPSVERRIAKAMADGCDAIVLDIDTPGGRMDVTLDICNLLKDRAETPANTVAWIHPQAYSAGTIIALACREIIVAPNATFGDAAPIQIDMLGQLAALPPAERAKIEAPLLAEVIDSARRNHYDENLAQAFVSVGIALWMIEDTNTGERLIVDAAEYAAVFDEEPPAQITAVSPPQTLSRGVKPFFRSFPADPSATANLSPEQIRHQIELQQTLPPSRVRLAGPDGRDWRLVGQVVSDERLLTVKADEALFYGLASATIADDVALAQFFGAASVQRYDRTWSEGLVRLLISPWVRIVLLVIFILSLFIAMAIPGTGIFEVVAGASLLILIGAPSLGGLAQWWDLLLIGVGLILIAVEIFVIPGLGVPGIAGALCLLVGLVGTFITSDPWSPEGQSELGVGLLSVLTAVFAGGVGMWLISRRIHSFPIINRLMLQTEVAGPVRSPDPGAGMLRAMAAAAPPPELTIGAIGQAATDLRPAGRGTFDDRPYDVQSPARFVAKGAAIRVLRVDGMVVIVEEVDP